MSIPLRAYPDGHKQAPARAQTGPTFKMKLRRRRQGKTDYSKRLALLKSGMPRLVVRFSNRFVRAQFSEFQPEGDRVRVQASASELDDLGFKGSKNLPSAYLTGLLAGQRAREAGIKEAILDIGRVTPVRKGRAFATLKGALDAGVAIPHSPEALPSEERFTGQHIAAFARGMSEEQRQRAFGALLAAGQDPVQLPARFATARSKIGGVQAKPARTSPKPVESKEKAAPNTQEEP